MKKQKNTQAETLVKLIQVKKLIQNTITKMSPLKPSAKTFEYIPGPGRPNLENPIKGGFVCGSVNNVGTEPIFIFFTSVLPDTDLTDDALTIPPGTIYNFDAIAGRFYPDIIVFVPGKCETIFWY